MGALSSHIELQSSEVQGIFEGDGDAGMLRIAAGIQEQSGSTRVCIGDLTGVRCRECPLRGRNSTFVCKDLPDCASEGVLSKLQRSFGDTAVSQVGDEFVVRALNAKQQLRDPRVLMHAIKVFLQNQLMADPQSLHEVSSAQRHKASKRIAGTCMQWGIDPADVQKLDKIILGSAGEVVFDNLLSKFLLHRDVQKSGLLRCSESATPLLPGPMERHGVNYGMQFIEGGRKPYVTRSKGSGRGKRFDAGLHVPGENLFLFDVTTGKIQAEKKGMEMPNQHQEFLSDMGQRGFHTHIYAVLLCEPEDDRKSFRNFLAMETSHITPVILPLMPQTRFVDSQLKKQSVWEIRRDDNELERYGWHSSLMQPHNSRPLSRPGVGHR